MTAKRYVRMQTLKVWNEDFPLLAQALKMEYRTPPRATPVRYSNSLAYPRPLLVETVSHAGAVVHCLMVCEAIWHERLMAISDESLAAEGFASIDQYKRYWLLRTGSRPRPLSWVTCRRLRTWRQGDVAMFGVQLMRELYLEAFDEALASEA